MIGRVKVTTSIERSVSLYTPPDKNTYNGKHAAFSIRRENALFILVQTTGAPVSRFVASHWCLQSLLRQKEFSVFLLLDQRPGYYWAPPGVRSTSALALAKGTTKNIIPIYTCLLVFMCTGLHIFTVGGISIFDGFVDERTSCSGKSGKLHEQPDPAAALTLNSIGVLAPV